MSLVNKIKGICIIVFGLSYFMYLGSPLFNAWTIGYENRESGLLMDIFAPFMLVIGNFMFVAPLPISLISGWMLITKPSDVRMVEK